MTLSCILCEVLLSFFPFPVLCFWCFPFMFNYFSFLFCCSPLLTCLTNSPEINRVKRHHYVCVTVRSNHKFSLYFIITRDDVVSQCLEFGSAFLSSSWESKIALLPYPYPEPVPKKLCDFYWLQLRIKCKSGWIAQAKKKKMRQQRREK